jgi:hypothetical protein
LLVAPAAAVVPFTANNNNHRQLELCQVSMLRVLYWAQTTVDELSAPPTPVADDDDDRKRKKKYLETRLCAKAMLTGKMGGGSTGKVYQLASLQIPGCLSDLEYYIVSSSLSSNSNSNSKSFKQVLLDAKVTFYESLASIVEFDGLETLLDPSPRSSLTLGQYNEKKVQYIVRVLKEQTIPSGRRLVAGFGMQPYQIAQNYINQYYKSEIYVPPPIQPIQQPPNTETETAAPSTTATGEEETDIVSGGSSTYASRLVTDDEGQITMNSKDLIKKKKQLMKNTT